MFVFAGMDLLYLAQLVHWLLLSIVLTQSVSETPQRDGDYVYIKFFHISFGTVEQCW